MATIEKRSSEGYTGYRAKIRIAGFPPQTASFERLSDAKRWVIQTENKLREGRHFQAKPSDKTMSEAIDRYIENVLPQKEKLYTTQKPQLLWWKSKIGAYALANLTPATIVEARDLLTKGITKQGNLRSPATVNRYMAALSHVFTYMYKEWGWIQENPFSKLKKFKESRGRVRFLTDNERNRLLQECKNSQTSILFTVVILALSTGARKNEIMSLNWKSVNLNKNAIILEDTKNGERRVLPVMGLAYEVLSQHAAASAPYPDTDSLVFPRANDRRRCAHIRGAFNLAVERAGIENFRFHDLRHCTASYLAMNGASLTDIAEVLGHKTLSMVKRYAHLSDVHTATVVESMNRKIFANVNIG